MVRNTSVKDMSAIIWEATFQKKDMSVIIWDATHQ